MVGTRVRLLTLPIGVLDPLSESEAKDVQSMVGQTFDVEEIDEHGCAWVTRWWHIDTSNSNSHSLSLSSENMEVV